MFWNKSKSSSATPRTRVKVYAERNTGSIYLEWLLKNNLYVNLHEGTDLGWKRRIAPSLDEISEAHRLDTVFACLVKNPYPWLLSMHRKPYKHDNLKKLTFSEFIRTSFGDYKNPMVLWSKKYQSYLNLSTYVNKHTFIKYEDLLKDPEETIDKFSEEFNTRRLSDNFQELRRHINEDGKITDRKFHSSYYNKESWRKAISEEDYTFINSQLDHNLVKIFSYELIKNTNSLQISAL